MHTEFLNLPVWDDDELSEALSAPILRREKLHHWPLSYVERVDLPGQAVVVKYTKLSVENAFYATTTAPYLVKPVLMTEIDDTSVTVLPFIHGREPVRDEIQPALDAIHATDFGTLWLDCSTHAKFMDAMRETAAILKKHDPAADPTEFLAHCEAFAPFFTPEQIGYIHGDLKADNLMVSSTGILSSPKTYILDWQRPMRGPKIIDAVTCGLSDDPDAKRLAKAFESYWLLYAFDLALSALPHVLFWAKKNLSGI